MKGKHRTELNVDTDAWVVYQLLQSLDYEMHLALAEFVDNSVQSFLDNRKTLAEMGQKQVQVIITIISLMETVTGVIVSLILSHGFRIIIRFQVMRL